MALGDITDDIRTLYRNMRKWGDHYIPIADALRDAHGAKLKAEFLHMHDECELVRNSSAITYCSQCGSINLDPRHKYDDPAWQEAAEKELTTP